MSYVFEVQQVPHGFAILQTLRQSRAARHSHWWPEESIVLHPARGATVEAARAAWLTAPERRWVLQARSLPDQIAGIPVFPLWSRQPDELPLWGLFPRAVLRPWLDRGWIAPRVDACWALGFELTDAGEAIRHATRTGEDGRIVLCLPEGGAPASPSWGSRLLGSLDRIAAALPPPEASARALARWCQAAEAAISGQPTPPGLPRGAREALTAYFRAVRPLPVRDPWPAAQWRAWARQWVRIAHAHGVLTAHGWLLGRLATPEAPAAGHRTRRGRAAAAG
ncbi:MAG: hypothetical protein K6U14_05230 [Firmicutes bacterium]|nr:hypothetical protein [Alicyclobacillaceae bacterium]MCL6497021.1 hypothetical protein [Bacillota bacterium]